MADAMRGSCLCGSIAFEIRPPFVTFRYCHCSRCQKASGSAHAANLFVPAAQFAWTKGEATVKHYHLAASQRFGVSFCPTCGTRVPHKVKTREDYLVPAGVLDDDPGVRPENSIFWDSKALWYVTPDTHDRMSEYK